jgi:hypothetical protein
MPRQRSVDVGLLLISFLLYGFIGFGIARYETTTLLLTYYSLFIVYGWIVFHAGESQTNFWLMASLAFRFVLLFNVPNLSDDFYRFIWDGRLLASGYHPFAEVPSFYMAHPNEIKGIGIELFSKLNSKDYFTIYPPVAQFIFWSAAKLSPDSIYGSMVVMKVILLGAEIGTLLVARQLLAMMNISTGRVLIYALNPLVIIEIVGNVHLEGLLIFFLLLSLLLLYRRKLIFSGLSMAMAICAKLIPVIFLPALLPRMGWKRAAYYYMIAVASCILLFIPIWDKEILSGFYDSLGYYFKKFEFNASIYYLVREWGFWVYGYNIIQTVGWKLALVSSCIIILLSYIPFRKVSESNVSSKDVDVTLFVRFLFILLTYYIFTTTLHPWYVTTLLALSIFTGFRFPVIWTALIFLTYTGYSKVGFQENFIAVAIEYITVIGYFAYELLWRKKHTLPA